MTVNLEWQDQHGRWHHLQSKQNQTDDYRVAMQRAVAAAARGAMGREGDHKGPIGLGAEGQTKTAATAAALNPGAGTAGC